MHPDSPGPDNAKFTRPTSRRPCSVLDALTSMTPPSPVLTPRILSSTWESSEVPVFLFNSESNDDIASRRFSNVSNITALDIPSSNSSDTVQTTHTFGTFGQFRRKSQHSRRKSSMGTVLADDRDSEVESHPLADLLDLSSFGPLPDQEPNIASAPSRPESANSRKSTSGPVLPSGLSVSPPSPSPSVYSTSSCSSSARPGRLRHETQRLSYSDYAGDLHSTSALCELAVSCYESANSLPSLAVSQFRHDRKASSASDDSTLPRTPLPSSPTPSPAPGPMSAHVELPKNLEWLKHTVVEMLIDQEGFRSITPSFRFAGFSKNTRSLAPGEDVLEGGAAQFIPVTRQTFNFHYAPFDGQPVLRRITVNGTSRDHVSRQATMNLKSNGVYTVRGTETSLIPSKIAGDNYAVETHKLRWKFDYYVDDRKGSGRIEGEKTFTPLTFSCSPLLLHPLQGKKVRLMQVVKKSVVPKLVAEKMELPKTTPSRSPSPAPSETAVSPPPQQPRTDPIEAHLWNLHRRFQSHGHSYFSGRSEPAGPRTPSRLGTSRVNEAHLGDQQVVFRRRRASSAGERNVMDISRLYKEEGKDVWNSSTSTLSPNRGPPVVSYERHIISPAKLSRLLDNIENKQPSVQQVECQVLTYGLTPAPRKPRK